MTKPHLSRLFISMAATTALSICAAHASTPAQGPVHSTVPETVTTSPYLGLRSAFDAHDLVVNLPSINEDLRLLEQRSKLEKKLGKEGGSFNDRAQLEVSGEIAASMHWNTNYTGPSDTSLALSTARLDILGKISPWITGLMSLAFDNAPGAGGSRISNSRMILRRGFFTVGNLNKTPFYASAGQMYVPFGQYASAMINAPMTLPLGKTNAHALLVGYAHDELESAVYVFDGETDTSGSGINDWGFNIGYTVHKPDWTINMGAGYISNIANSGGMQSTGGAFPGFDNPGYQTLDHGVEAINGHVRLSCDEYSLIAEYVATTQAFDANNMTFNTLPAKPKALQAELGYHFSLFDKSAGLSVGYSQTWSALALNLPEKRYSMVLSTSYWKNTTQAIELRHDVDYAVADAATGQTDTVAGTGGSRNVVSAQFSVYF